MIGKLMHLVFKVIFFALFITLSIESKAAVVLQYHHVDDNTPYATSISPSIFIQHMQYLADNNFRVLPLPQLIELLKNGESLNDKNIAITFDDGYKSVYRSALPVLQKHGFPFTIFINPSLVDGNLFMSWDELRESTKHGGIIANHTVSHPHLVRYLDGESHQQWKERIKYEIAEAEKIIRKQIGHSPKLLAYPYGEFNNDSKSIAENLNLVAFAQHSGAFDENVDWQAVPRFAFGGQYVGMDSFVDKVNSLPMQLEEVIVFDENGQRLDEALLPMNSTKPKLTLKLKSIATAQQIQCYASSIGRIDIKVNSNTVTTQLKDNLPIGRSRINCTAPSQQRGRFYWYSQLFLRKKEDGSWYQEH